METADLVIIGAGWHGLAAAKTALDVDSSLNVIVFEANSSVGGVWAKDRLYSGLRTNNLLGSYEYSDYPMDQVVPGLKPGEPIPGAAVHAYLDAYTHHFGLTPRIRLNHKVTSAEYTADRRWMLGVLDSRPDMSASPTSLLTTKLIMATGLTSQPLLPQIPGEASFRAPIFHNRDFAANEASVTTKGPSVTVLGGGKSAWDIVYACASSGRPVDWIIRKSGHGPIWMSPPFATPLKIPLEKLPATRILTWFSPCAWADESTLIRQILHRTWPGQKLVSSFWALMKDDMVRANRYADHPDTQKLQPSISPFWVATLFGILNYPSDFLQLVRDGIVRVHIEDIVALSAKTVHLSNNAVLSSSALIYCTGWQATPDIRFSPPGLETQLGFPWASDPIPSDLVTQTKTEILRNFPQLRNQPVPNKGLKPLSGAHTTQVNHAFRLTRFIAPVAMWDDRAVAFCGNVMTFSTPLMAEVQALWAVAYLHGKLSDCRRDEVVRETVLHTEFARLRYPGGYGARNADFAFDVLPYVDTLLKDLGVSSRRKSSLWGHLFWPHGLGDYRGLVGEWKRLQRQ